MNDRDGPGAASDSVLMRDALERECHALARSETLVVGIPGEPVAKGRPRFNGKTGTVYTPTKTRSAEKAIAWEAKRAACASASTTSSLSG